MGRDSTGEGARSPRPARFLLRLPAPLHRALLEQARSRQLSLNELIVRRLSGAAPFHAVEELTALLLARARAVADRRLVGVILHGSWIRGEARTTSDVDALIVTDDSLPLTRALYRTWDEEAIVWRGRTVDVHFVHLPRGVERATGVWCEAAIEGRVVADFTGRVEDTLMTIRRAIADGRLVRKRAHGQPYWTAA